MLSLKKSQAYLQGHMPVQTYTVFGPKKWPLSDLEKVLSRHKGLVIT